MMGGAARPSTGDVYHAIDQLVRKVEGFMLSVPAPVRSHDAATVRRRLAQRFVEVASPDLSVWLASESFPPFPAPGGVKLDPDRGALRLTARFALLSLGLFLAEWVRNAVAIAASIARAPGNGRPVTLLTEAGGIVGGSDKPLADFCRSGPIGPLRDASVIVVRAAPPSIPTDERLVYASVMLSGAAEASLSRAGRGRLLMAHMRAPLELLRAIFRHPLALLISRDLAVLSAYDFLDREKRIRDIVTTTSAFTSQPLWMSGQNYRLHMMWYSQNFIPKMYRGDARRPDLPQARHIRVDEHWVWTDGFAQYLQNLGTEARIHVVGPILWQVPEDADLGQEAALRIVLFDVTPVKAGANVFGAAVNYYSPERMARFVTDTVTVAEEVCQSLGRPMVLLLKHKRSADRARYDESYLDLIDQLTQVTPRVRLLPHTTNLFGLLKGCDLSISVPYTSTAYVAAFLGRPAVYYDAGGELVPCHEEHPLVRFASDKETLRRLIRQAVSGPGDTANHALGHADQGRTH